MSVRGSRLSRRRDGRSRRRHIARWRRTVRGRARRRTGRRSRTRGPNSEGARLKSSGDSSLCRSHRLEQVPRSWCGSYGRQRSRMRYRDASGARWYPAQRDRKRRSRKKWLHLSPSIKARKAHTSSVPPSGSRARRPYPSTRVPRRGETPRWRRRSPWSWNQTLRSRIKSRK